MLSSGRGGPVPGAPSVRPEEGEEQQSSHCRGGHDVVITPGWEGTVLELCVKNVVKEEVLSGEIVLRIDLNHCPQPYFKARFSGPQLYADFEWRFAEEPGVATGEEGLKPPPGKDLLPKIVTGMENGTREYWRDNKFWGPQNFAEGVPPRNVIGVYTGAFSNVHEEGPYFLDLIIWSCAAPVSTIEGAPGFNSNKVMGPQAIAKARGVRRTSSSPLLVDETVEEQDRGNRSTPGAVPPHDEPEMTKENEAEMLAMAGEEGQLHGPFGSSRPRSLLLDTEHPWTWNQFRGMSPGGAWTGPGACFFWPLEGQLVRYPSQPVLWKGPRRGVGSIRPVEVETSPSCRPTKRGAQRRAVMEKRALLAPKQETPILGGKVKKRKPRWALRAGLSPTPLQTRFLMEKWLLNFYHYVGYDPYRQCLGRSVLASML